MDFKQIAAATDAKTAQELEEYVRKLLPDYKDYIKYNKNKQSDPVAGSVLLGILEEGYGNTTSVHIFYKTKDGEIREVFIEPRFLTVWYG